MRVLLLAGEPSGDHHAAAVARALRRLQPDVELAAMGGSELAEAGARIVVDAAPLSVVGLTEVIGSLRPLLAARRRLRETIVAWRPDVVVPVDYPDFNLRIARFARRRGVPVAYYVSPQVWAWRPARVPGIGRAVSRMLVIFGFETAIYERHGIPVEHVGHPLLDRTDEPPSREQARAALALPADARVVALLPGSRRKELRHVWPVFRDAAELLRRGRDDVRFVLPLAAALTEADLERAAPRGDLPLTVVPRGAARAVAACDVAAVCSGTATLETALAGRPLVAGYRVSPLTMRLSRRLAEPGFLSRGLFALPNLVLGRQVVPELYQERFTAPAVAEAVGRLLDDPAARQAMVAELAALRPALGGPGTAERVARAVIDVAREGRG